MISTRADIEAWVAAYEAAWRAPGTERLAELFTPDAVYRMSPYEPPARGLREIAELWEREREGPDEEFELSRQIVAVEGDVGVIRVEVLYGRGTEYRDLWVIHLCSDGRCREFEEWPYFPGQLLSSKRS